MRAIGLGVLFTVICLPVFGQSLTESVYETQRAFDRAVAEQGVKPAFLEFLAQDAVVFRPEAVNGPEYFRNGGGDKNPGQLIRRVNFADMSSNGLLGYTTGEWTLTQKGKPGAEQKIGQYATVWSRMQDGKYKAILDIEISHEPYRKKARRSVTLREAKERDDNKRRWSAADTTMNFLKMSMTRAGLEGAYDRFAAEDVRLFREGLRPINGRGDAEEVMGKLIAVDFPSKVAQFETADMAYSWNPCSYADSNEGMEKGNCLHIWKFRDKRWWVVLGVFAKIPNEMVPVLKDKKTTKKR